MNISKITNRISEAFIVSSHTRTAKVLSTLSDRQLADIGISRELLKNGANSYPWRDSEAVIAQEKPATATVTAVASKPKQEENTRLPAFLRRSKAAWPLHNY